MTSTEAAPSQSITKNVAVGAASAGAGGAFSYILFDKVNISQQLEEHTVFSLAVFSLVALVVLITGYLVLPRARGWEWRDWLLGGLMVFFALIVSAGVIQALNAPPPAPTAFKVLVQPALASTLKGIPDPFEIKLYDGAAYQTLADTPVESRVLSGQQLIVFLPNLPTLIDHYRLAITETDNCRRLEHDGGVCYPRATLGTE